MLVSELPEDYTLVNIDHEVEATREMIPDKTPYLAYFVRIKNGELIQAYGITQQVAYMRLIAHEVRLK